VEGFLLQRVVQRVVIEFDLLRLGNATVNVGRGLAGIAQAAARTSALNATLESDNFHDCSKRKRRLATKPSGERGATLRPANTAEEPSNRRFLQ
jgi:hypothetical protein